MRRSDEPPAAYIVESIMCCGGQVQLPHGYLPGVYELTRAAGGLMIADEVQTGFGRTGGHYWAFEAHGVVPDVVTMGKVCELWHCGLYFGAGDACLGGSMGHRGTRQGARYRHHGQGVG